MADSAAGAGHGGQWRRHAADQCRGHHGAQCGHALGDQSGNGARCNQQPATGGGGTGCGEGRPDDQLPSDPGSTGDEPGRPGRDRHERPAGWFLRALRPGDDQRRNKLVVHVLWCRFHRGEPGGRHELERGAERDQHIQCQPRDAVGTGLHADEPADLRNNQHAVHDGRVGHGRGELCGALRRGRDYQPEPAVGSGRHRDRDGDGDEGGGRLLQPADRDGAGKLHPGKPDDYLRSNCGSVLD